MDALSAFPTSARLTRELRAASAKRTLPPPEIRRQIRVAAGVTQTAVAEALGVGGVTVARWESSSGARRRTPRGELLIRYCELLDLLRSGP